jgi:hypothetical protein
VGIKKSARLLRTLFCTRGYRGRLQNYWLKRSNTLATHTGKILEQIEDLLGQFANSYNYTIELHQIAEDILDLTLEYKGLVGSCCFAIETELINGKNQLTLADWQKYAGCDLFPFIEAKGFFKSIVRTLKNLTPDKAEIVSTVFRSGRGAFKKVNVVGCRLLIRFLACVNFFFE